MGMDAMTRMTRMIRGLSMASSLAMSAALLAAPVAADGGSTTDADGSTGYAASELAVSVHQDSLDDWSRILVSVNGARWTVPVLDTETVDVETQSGVAPSGVEWTRVTASDPSEVEWTRLSASTPNGSSWIETSTVDPSGVEWTFLTHASADGSSWVESRFVDVDGHAWSRRALGDALDGVEWT